MAAQPDLTAILAALAKQVAPAAGQAPGPGGAAPPLPPPPSGPPQSRPPPPNSYGSAGGYPPAPSRAGPDHGPYGSDHRAGYRSSPYDSRRSPGWHGHAYKSRSRSRSPEARDKYGSGYGQRDRDRSYGYMPPRSRDIRTPDRYSQPPPPRGRSPGPQEFGSEVMMVESQLVGLIIGRQGETLKRIEHDTGARIQFLPTTYSTDPQRPCRITGSGHQRSQAKGAIKMIIEDSVNLPRPKPPSGRYGAPPGAPPPPPSGREGSWGDNDESKPEQIMIPDRTVGLVIGRAGETIRDLQERSGCHVNIVGESQTVNGLRPVNLTGSKQAKQRAKELIMQVVETDTRTGPPPSGGPPNRDFGGPDKGPGARQYIMIDSRHVGMIIGKGGEAIKWLMDTTGCRIYVSQPEGPDLQRQVTLIGPKESTDAAISIIQEKIANADMAHSEKAPRPRGYESSGYGREYSGSASGAPSGSTGYDNYNSAPPPPQYGGYGSSSSQYPPSNQYSSGPGPAGGAPAGAPPPLAGLDPYKMLEYLKTMQYPLQSQYPSTGSGGHSNGDSQPHNNSYGYGSGNGQHNSSAYDYSKGSGPEREPSSGTGVPVSSSAVDKSKY